MGVRAGRPAGAALADANVQPRRNRHAAGQPDDERMAATDRNRWTALALTALLGVASACGADDDERRSDDARTQATSSVDSSATGSDRSSTTPEPATTAVVATTTPPTSTSVTATTTPAPTTIGTIATLPIEPDTYGASVNAVVAMRPPDEPPGDATGPLFLSAGAGSLWVGIHRASAVHRVDPDTGAIVATIAIDPTAGSMAETELVTTGAGTGTGSVLATEDAVWVADVGGFVWRIEPATDRIVARIELPGLFGESGLLDAHGSIWALTQTGARRIDPATNEVVAELDLGHPRCCNGPQAAATEDAVWLGSDDGAIRVDPSTNTATAVVDIDPIGLGALPLGTSGGLVWGVRPLKIWAIDPTTNEVVKTIDKPSDVGPLAADSAVLADGTLWVLAYPEDQQLGIDRWFQLVRFDLTTGASEVLPLMNAEHEFIVGLAVTDHAVWATDFARGNLLRVDVR